MCVINFLLSGKVKSLIFIFLQLNSKLLKAQTLKSREQLEYFSNLQNGRDIDYKLYSNRKIDDNLIHPIDYLILAPSAIYPDSILKVVFHIFDRENFLISSQHESLSQVHVKISIFKNGESFLSNSENVALGRSQNLQLKVPSELSSGGSYKLVVEGNYNGSSGGSIIINESPLQLQNKTLLILIQTNRFVYNGNQIVRFRCILLQRDLKAYNSPATVIIMDPRGIPMRKWPSVHPKFGVIELDYELPDFSILGNWIIRVETKTQQEDNNFIVEKYYRRPFEVSVSMPPFIDVKNEIFSVEVIAFFSTENNVQGNCTTSLFGKIHKNGRWTLISSDTFIINGNYELEYKISDILREIGRNEILSNDFITIRVEANVTDFFIGDTRNGFAESRLIKNELQLKFMNENQEFFKPGLYFQTYLKVSYGNNIRISSDVLSTSKIKIKCQIELNSGSQTYTEYIIEDKTKNKLSDNGYEITPINNFTYSQYFEQSLFKDYTEDGIIVVKVKMPQRGVNLVINAEYSDENGSYLSASKTIEKYHSVSKQYISISISSTKNLKIGEYAVFQFSSSFYLKNFFYIVMSKGLILHNSEEILPNSYSRSKSFSFPISSQMLPGFHLFVYHINSHSQIISDSIFVPLPNLFKNELKFDLNESKDKKKDYVEGRFYGEPTSYVGLISTRKWRYFMHPQEEISRVNLLKKFYELEPYSRHVNKVQLMSFDEEKIEEIKYLVTQNGDFDSISTFNNGNIMLFPNSSTYNEKSQKRPGDIRDEYLYKKDQIQNQDDNLKNGLFDDIDLFLLNRVNHIMDFYDGSEEGDWAWVSGNIGPTGDNIFSLQVPKITDVWKITPFMISPVSGFTLLDYPIEYDSKRPFMMLLDGPNKIRSGEQVGILVILQNNTPKDVYATVELSSSDDYSFVKLGSNPDGNLNEGNIQIVSGTIQHLVWIPAESHLEVRMPVKPHVQNGAFSVKISAITQIRNDVSEIEIEVIPEGVQISKHTSLLLDLTNRATVLKFLNIFTEESPLIPRDNRRKYIYGTPSAHLFLYGDIIGPIFNNIPLTTESLIGRKGHGTSDALFELFVNFSLLHYLRSNNELGGKYLRKVLRGVEKIYGTCLRGYNSEGGYLKNWEHLDAAPSLWLTGWALQVFVLANFQDWENYFIVDKLILHNMTRWILKHQDQDGSFSDHNNSTFNKKMSFLLTQQSILRNSTNFVCLTAHILISLHQTLPHLDGEIKLSASLAKLRAMQFLEKKIIEIFDPYQSAIVAYALTITDSPERDSAFEKLFSLRTENAEHLYWSPDPIPSNAFIYENQRPFLEAKNNEFWDSYAVEGTSYALLTFLTREGITHYAEQIVAWLISMKLTDGAFISTIDTAVAISALVEYSNRARLREVTDLSVQFDVSSLSNNELEPIQINSKNLIDSYNVEIPNAWGQVNVVARGSGTAVLQLDVSYGVEWEEFKDTPPTQAFNLQITEYYSEFRNKSSLTIQACFNWVLLSESPVSGGAVIEIQIPSGYYLVPSDYEFTHPTLREFIFEPGKTSWYFDHISTEMTCFNHTVRRWYPVANLTTYKQATIYETFSVERFENFIYSDISLHQLQICHVCGSFQCPYCPHFSRSQKLTIPKISMSLIILVSYALLKLLS